MRLSSFVIALAALTLGLSVRAHAQAHEGAFRYKWTDSHGLAHYSDSLTDDAIKSGYDVVNDQGMVISHVQKLLSPTERAAAQQQAAQQATQERVEQQRARDDIQMLNAYPDEASLKTEQQGELDNLDQQINTTKINLRSQEKALADLLARAAEVEHTKESVPKALNDSIVKQRNVVANQRDVLLRQQAGRDATVQQQQQQLQHYRDLKTAQKDDRGY
ncbi:MAG: DUF4124 domain-containing protein [Rhodanobacter sp.]